MLKHSSGLYLCPSFLALFTFLRLYNKVPSSVSAFDPLVHLCRGDIIYQPQFTTIIHEWSKTIQASSQFATVQIRVHGRSPSFSPRFQMFPPNASLFATSPGSVFCYQPESSKKDPLSHFKLPPH